MSWITPKTDWTTDDGVMATDLNRIEGNSLAIRDGLLKKKLSYYANNATAGGGAYNIRVIGGNLFSQSAVLGVMPGTFDIQKALGATEWAAGDGTGSPCRVADAQAVGANQWWYVFVLYNPTTAAFDVCMDDDFAGANIAGSAIETAGYTMWKRVACQFEAGNPVTDAARLWDTVGRENHFSISEGQADSGVHESITGSTLTIVALNGDSLTGTPAIIPPGLSLPINLVFRPNGTVVNRLYAHGGDHQTTISGVNYNYLYFDGDEYNTQRITLIPNSDDEINLTTSATADWTIIVVGWIDDAND